MIRSVEYLSEQAFLQRLPREMDVAISIASADRGLTIPKGYRQVIRCSFLDMEYGPRELEFAGIDWWLASGAIGPDDAEKLRAWIRRLAESAQEYHLVVHCHAGQSRSAAVAQYVHEAHGANLPQGLSPKANKTVLALLANPWSYISKTEFEARTMPWWRRWIAWLVRGS